MLRKTFFTLLLFLAAAGIWGQKTISLKIAGVDGKPGYFKELLTQALKARGYDTKFVMMGELTGPRVEALLLSGELTAVMMGETDERSSKFLPVRVHMMNNLIGKRILFIPKGSQKEFDGIKTLEDLRKTGKVAGMGLSWAEMEIWKVNNLAVTGIDGDWKVLYKMVEARDRGVDYLPRGANEMMNERAKYPNLDMEKNLLLVYDKDQIMYVSPKNPELKPLLEKAMFEAQNSGLIKRLVSQFFGQVFEPPFDIDHRTVIHLSLP